jgi:hypothetical protein
VPDFPDYPYPQAAQRPGVRPRSYHGRMSLDGIALLAFLALAALLVGIEAGLRWLAGARDVRRRLRRRERGETSADPL